MSVDFSPPSYRASGQDLTVSVSPLGLVELADEEFEVHGPRLNRYSMNWALYLGHHWSYRREQGESQLTFNYFRAFTDYLTNFCFGKGVQFRSPKETEAIVPDLLKRVWEVDNDKRSVLFEMGQQGGVSGDCFVKVAYEEPFNDAIGRFHPGRVRILPINASYAFPEWHPHDRSRLIRFKMKYRFWGTSLEGTRQVFTYTEILTDESIEEYLNDELIDSRPNPLGQIPVVHIPNRMVSGSPWGLADCHDIGPLNRTYNEVATDIADIVNYHAAPVTIVTGAKISQLEKGARKVWAGLPDKAQVFNLEGGHQGLQAGLTFLEQIKRSMHEQVGIPETALGQMQPISNTSGVALSIQFQPTMNVWGQKVATYGLGLERINELALLTLAIKEPDSLRWNPDTDVPLKPGQLDVLDPADPITYQSIAHFPPPLPLDKLIVLNEIQLEMAIGLESREGALRKLGEEFPDEKLAEIRAELMDDAMSDGALQLMKTQIASEIYGLTGMMPGENGAELPPTDGGGGPGGPGGGLNAQPQPQQPQPTADPALVMDMQAEWNIRSELVTRAYGTKLPGRRSPDSSD